MQKLALFILAGPRPPIGCGERAVHESAGAP
jgi:hypothetical protein